MQTTHQTAKSQTENNLETLKKHHAKPAKKERFILRNDFDDFHRLASLFTINEYGYRVIGGRRIC